MTSNNDLQSNSNNEVANPKKFKKRFIIIPIVVVLVLAIAISTFMFLPANISRGEAQEIAIAHVNGGRANRAERDFEGFQRVWSVEVFYDGLVHEIYVSMRTGEVVRVEIDNWD